MLAMTERWTHHIFYVSVLNMKALSSHLRHRQVQDRALGMFLPTVGPVELLNMMRRVKNNPVPGFKTGGQHLLKCSSLRMLERHCDSAESTQLV